MRERSGRDTRHDLRDAWRLAAVVVVAACSTNAAPLLAAKKADALPYSVEVQVHWGTKKNREAYRSGFEHSVLADLLSKACFEKVRGSLVERAAGSGGGAGGSESGGTPGTTDLLLEIQLNDLVTEQEYDSAETIIPGQGEEHQLRSARATVNLDYWLRPQGKNDAEIVSGHIYREAVRQPQYPTDSADERALRDLVDDASHWVVRDLCDRRGRLLEKITKALAAPAPDRH